MSGLLDPNELRRILKRADTKSATWQEMDLVRAHIAALEKERDAALADNAALVEVLGDVAHRSMDTLGGQDAHDRAVRVHAQPHPGAALLEEHRKALVRARNEGLELLAKRLIERRDQMQGRAMADGRRRGLEEAASIARAMKEPESD